MVHIGNDWDAILADEWEKEYYLQLRQTLKQEYATRRVYPPCTTSSTPLSTPHLRT